jgi:histidinol-phosphate aminotransferase
MAVSRRDFLHPFGWAGTGAQVPRSALTGAFIGARGLEALLAEAQQEARSAPPVVPPGVAEIRISSNENPLGPGQRALDAIVGKFPEAGRYPFNSTPLDSDLVAAIAKKFDTKPANVVLGAGSQEILKTAVRAFTSPAKALVAGSPTFENCTNIAKQLKHKVVEVKVDGSFRLDVDAMIAAAKGAGLVYFNNPNNPTATVHPAKPVSDLVARIHRSSPNTAILIDEAYHDYVTDPSYQSAVPLALETPNVFVTRTFSKAYGMAGMRIGYAIGQVDTIKALARLKMPYNVSVLGVAAAIAALDDQRHIEQERARNTAAREFTLKALDDLGCRATDSQANFVFVEIHRPAKDFRDACAKSGVVVGRDFPPFEKTHARISIGTMDEMNKAVDVFRSVLRAVTTTAGKAQ